MSTGHQSPRRGCHIPNQPQSVGIKAVLPIPTPSDPRPNQHRRVPSVGSCKLLRKPHRRYKNALHIAWEITVISRATAALSEIRQYVGPRLGAVIFSLIAFCIPVIALTWCFDVINDLQARVVVTVLAGWVPVLGLMASPAPWYSRQEFLWFGVFLWLTLLVIFADRFEWLGLKMNAVVLVAILPYCWIIWLLMARRWILLCALLFGLFWMMVYWLKAMANADAPLELLLLPVPTFLLLGIAWAPLARFALDRAKNHKTRSMAGPGTQVLAMISLFLPSILIAFIVPDMLNLHQTWSAASLTIGGVLLSAVIAEPLRRFLLLWAKLGPDDG